MPVRSPNRIHDKDFFFKYTSAEVARKVLETNSIRWSGPALFNDKLDIATGVKFPYGMAELQQAVGEAAILAVNGELETKDPKLLWLRNQVTTMAPERREAFYAEVRRLYREDTPKNAVLTAFDTNWRELRPRLRILCLSEVPDSTTMWAYYADNYKGVVLGLCALDISDSSLLRAKPVIYSDDPPALPTKEALAAHLISKDAPPWEDWFRDHHYLKTTNWSHEREWRVVTYARDGEEGAFSTWPFHPAELAFVILGPDMSPEDRQTISAITLEKYPAAQLLEAKVDDGARRILVREVQTS